MSFSADLSKIVTNFQAIDTAHHSINENFDQVGKRSGLQNFWRWFVHVITCGLVSKNPELDSASSKIVTLATQFFVTNRRPTEEQLTSLKDTFHKLEVIISDNQGAKYSQVHALATRCEKLLAGEKVTPIEDPTEPYQTLSELFDQLPVDQSSAKEDDKIKQLLQRILARIELKLADNSYEEIIAACNHTQNNQDNFRFLFTFLMFTSTKQQVEEILQNVQFTTDEEKNVLTAAIKNVTDEQKAEMRKQFEAMFEEPEQVDQAPEENLPEAEGQVDQQAAAREQIIANALASNNFTDFIAKCNAAKDDGVQFCRLIFGLGALWTRPHIELAQLLEKITFHSEDMKKGILGELIHKAQVILVKESTHNITLEPYEYMPLEEIFVNVRKLFGNGDHTEKSTLLPESYAQAVADLVKGAARHYLKEKRGVALLVSQQTECRFSAAMVRPLLAHLMAIPGLIRLNLADIGTKEGKGFLTSDSEALIKILESNSLVRDFRVNTMSMTEQERAAFDVRVNEIIEKRTADISQELEAAAKSI